MKEKIRNDLVKMSRSKYLELKVILAVFILLIVAALAWYGSQIPLAIVTLVAMLFVMWGWECLDAIQKCPQEILDKNKLHNIVFSTKEPWELPLLSAIITLTVIVVNLFKGEPSVTLAVVWIVLIFFVNVSLGNILPKIFKKRLIK